MRGRRDAAHSRKAGRPQAHCATATIRPMRASPDQPPAAPAAPPVWHDPMFRAGVRDMLAVSPGMAAWGLLTGVAMVKSGLSAPLAVLMSLLVLPAARSWPRCR